MPGKNYYFSKSVLAGAGKLFFLKIAQDASPNSAPSRLLGSFVNEGDGGLFGGAEYPVPQNSYILEAAVTAMRGLGYPDDTIFNEISLSGVHQEVKVENSVTASGEAVFPGAPISAGIGVDYKRVRKVVVKLGAGARKRFIPRDILREAYLRFAEDASKYPAVFFNDDRMLVDQVLLVRELELEVTSNTNFSADFEAKAEQMSNLNLGLKYEKKTDKSYTLKLDGAKEYLFALTAVQADKFLD